MLSICGLTAGYGQGAVLQGVDLQVRPGEIVAVLGRNGSGRSTLAKAVMGLVDWEGDMRWVGQSLHGLRTFEIAQLGIGYVPETRDVFGGLTVRQNLMLGVQPAPHAKAGTPWTLEDIYQLFAPLQARLHVDAAVLSGGEQQMLALGRCLMGAPALVLVDEPTEGLSPALVQQVAQCLRLLRARGMAVMLIEQKMTIALSIADRVVVMGQGRVVFDGSPAQLRERSELVQEWLQV